MTLTIVSPVGSDFIKDYPGQHAVISDMIDSYAGPCMPNNPMPSYTPTLDAQAGSPTATPSLGAGSIKGNYFTVFDQVYVWVSFRFGTGFSVGNGTYTISLPIELDSTIVPNGTLMGSWMPIGNGSVFDSDTLNGRQSIIVTPRTSTLVHFGTHINTPAGGRAVDHTGPITWASGDGITFSARYKRKP